MHKVKKFTYIVIVGMVLALFVYLIIPRSSTHNMDSHNCRFWGIIFFGSAASLEGTIRCHLDSLKSLGNSNPDGWGIAYYLSPDTGVILPIISRGEPKAPLDSRYDKVVDNMVIYIQKCGIAHVRKGISGITSGIPDPHPFQRDAIYRDFQMLFAHNGKIPEYILLDLIETIDPTYLDSNPPDYAPNYHDTDLFAIYMMEVIDTYLECTIDECIEIAITKLDSATGLISTQFNFIMSDGSTLWALRLVKGSSAGFPLHYYPNESMSDFWIAASEPLDTLQSFWTAVPNSTLVTLIPGQPPRLVNVLFWSEKPQATTSEGIGFVSPNPFRENTLITYTLTRSSNVTITIYDVTGRLIRTFLKIEEKPGVNTIVWDGKDDKGHDLPNGTFFCNIVIGDSSYEGKIVLVR